MSEREPLSDKRLAEIREAAESYPAVWSDVVLKVLDEVDRLRAKLEQYEPVAWLYDVTAADRGWPWEISEHLDPTTDPPPVRAYIKRAG